MANSITNDAAIYRCTNSTDTEANLPNDQSLGLDYGMKQSSTAAVVVWNWDVADRRTDVGSPLNRNVSKPDTGLGNIVLTIGIKFNETTMSDPGNYYVGELTLWGLQPKTIKSIFPYARFGIRNNKKPWMNFQPTALAGWKLVDVNFDDLLEWAGLIDCIITLEFAGQSSQIVNQVIATLGSF